MHLGHFLHSILGGAQKGVNKVENTVSKAASSVAHPAVQAINNLYNQTQVKPSPTILPQRGSYADPLSVGRVWGTAVADNVANEQQYTPMFKNIVMGAHPYVGQGNTALHNPGAGGEYSPGNNQISLKSDQLDPYTITHEGLHAAFNRKTPQAQLRFEASLLGDKDAARAVQEANAQMDSSPELYHGEHPLTEYHSYVPQNANLPTQLQQYYRHYFGNPNFYQEPTAKWEIYNKTAHHQKPQFDDWRDQ